MNCDRGLLITDNKTACYTICLLAYSNNSSGVNITGELEIEQELVKICNNLKLEQHSYNSLQQSEHSWTLDCQQSQRSRRTERRLGYDEDGKQA